MTTQASGRFWLCPQCGRHVPVRLEACRCGGTRAEVAEVAAAPEFTAAPEPAAVARPAYVPAPAGDLGDFGELDDLVYPHERSLFAIGLCISIAFWLLVLVGTLGIVLIYAAFFFVFYVFAQSALIAYIKGTAVKITPQQFPDLHERLHACCQRLGLVTVPETYLLHGDGVFNAFATRFLGANFVVLLSDVVDALDERPGAINFYLGHELAHIHRHHMLWRPVLLPASLLPLIGAAYHRAQEVTCDNYGAACCDDPEDAVVGLSVLAAGGKRWRSLSLPEYLAQASATSGFWMSFNELISDYPWLVKRVARQAARAQGERPDIPSRHPLAYFFAFFVPRTGIGAGGAGLLSLLVVVAVIGIIAAVAIPSLLKGRVSANESSALGDVRTFGAAQEAFQAAAGSYGTLDCLAAPTSQGCISDYPVSAPVFIDADTARLATKAGYERVFIPGESAFTPRSPSGIATYCYAAVPVKQGQTGVRSFATDHTGRICSHPRGRNLCLGAELPFDCEGVQ